MALLWLSCPHCRVLFHIDDATAGQQVSCRVCGHPIRIPGASPKPSLWYYTRDRKPFGPVSFEQIKELARAGQLLPDELIWQEGMAQWAPARTVEGLYPAPPPLPPERPQLTEAPVDIEELAIKEQSGDTAEPYSAVVDDEPVEIHADEPSSAPESIESPAIAVTADEKQSAEQGQGAEESVRNPVATPEEPLLVEPEFQIDLTAPKPKPEPTEPPPTVDLEFPASAEDKPFIIDPDIALVPDEPSLELGEKEPIEDPWSTGYDVVPLSKSPVRGPTFTSDTAHPPPLAPYPVEGEAPTTRSDTGPPPAAIPVGAIAAAPLTTPVSSGGTAAPAIPGPPAEQRPRRETEGEKRARLRQEYRQQRQAWTSVSRGIRLLNLTMAFWFAVIAGSMVIGTFIAIFTGETMRESQDSDAGSMVMMVQLLVMAIFVDPLSIVGFIHCLRVPENAGSRPLATASMVLTAIGIAGALVAALVAAFVPVLRFVVFGIGFARWLVFLFYLQSVAQYFEAHFLMRSMERLLLLLTGTVGLGVLLWIGMTFLSKTFSKSESDTAAMITMTCGTLCTTLPLVVLLGLSTMRYLRAMRDTLALIEEKLYRGELA